MCLSENCAQLSRSVSAETACMYTSCPPVTLATGFSWCHAPGSCSVLCDVLRVFVAIGLCL